MPISSLCFNDGNVSTCGCTIYYTRSSAIKERVTCSRSLGPKFKCRTARFRIVLSEIKYQMLIFIY